jgi:hypothetical protein
MIEQERSSALRGDPDQEAKLWADKLVEVQSKRTRYQEMAASELITFDELRAKLLELDETVRPPSASWRSSETTENAWPNCRPTATPCWLP